MPSIWTNTPVSMANHSLFFMILAHLTNSRTKVKICQDQIVSCKGSGNRIFEENRSPAAPALAPSIGRPHCDPALAPCGRSATRILLLWKWKNMKEPSRTQPMRCGCSPWRKCCLQAGARWAQSLQRGSRPRLLLLLWLRSLPGADGNNKSHYKQPSLPSLCSTLIAKVSMSLRIIMYNLIIIILTLCTLRFLSVLCGMQSPPSPPPWTSGRYSPNQRSNRARSPKGHLSW